MRREERRAPHPGLSPRFDLAHREQSRRRERYPLRHGRGSWMPSVLPSAASEVPRRGAERGESGQGSSRAGSSPECLVPSALNLSVLSVVSVVRWIGRRGGER